MLRKEIRQQIISLIHKEVVPAIGCTEPMAVALCVAKATETLGHKPEHIMVQLSPNMLKNAMGVGIPGTGMIGLPIAVALGALIGKSEYGLEVLRDITPEAVENGKNFMAENRIDIRLKDKEVDKLYIEVTCSGHSSTVIAVIAGRHDHLVYLVKDNQILLDEQNKIQNVEDESVIKLTLREVYDFAITTPLEELQFINEARKLNEKASKEALKGNYGHNLGKVLSRPLGRGIMGESMFSHMLSATSSACDARMAGAMIPVMSNSGSGNLCL